MVFEKKAFRYVLVICLVAMLAAISMYAYLGLFSRYLADDYCEAASVNGSSPIKAVFDRYSAGAFRASNRYSNLLFVGVSEKLGHHNMQITIVSMVLLWASGLTWCIHELRRYLRIDWFLPLDLFLGVTIGFFSLLQAPNLFQSVFWRSSMMTHFAPLVFGSFLFAFVVRQLRRLWTSPPSTLVYLISFFTAFIVAGFSEPPATTMITTLTLLMIAIWLCGKPPVKQRQLALLASIFMGVLLGLMVMILSPAGAKIAQARDLNLVVIFSKSFIYSYLFFVDSLKTIPLPMALSVIMPLMLIWLYKQIEPSPLSRNDVYIILIGIVTVPVLIWLLIAAGFAPSVYGQNYPVERMRFLARTIMIVAFMMEGALFGVLLKDIQFKYNRLIGQWVVLILFTVIAIVYPLRTAFNIYKFDVPIFRANAESWDIRDAQIRLAVDHGATDLVVVQLDSMNGVVEYKENRSFWVNRCAAQFYGLNSIIAIAP
ncbi:MAG: DUF6056 family protein [Chloroflexota bacterium]